MPTGRAGAGFMAAYLCLLFTFVDLPYAEAASSSELRQEQQTTPTDCTYLRRFLAENWPQYSKALPKDCCSSRRIDCGTDNSFISQLHLSGLGLNGTIDSGIFGHLQNISVIDLSNNLLTGVIPAEIWELPNLQYLNLSSNMFNGSALRQTYDASNLRELNVSFNHLDGEFLKNIVHLRNLTILDLRNSSLSGTLADSIETLTKLQVLFLSHNSLNGSIPSLQDLRDLRVLDLSFNNFNGIFPQDLVNLPHLTYLNVSYNDLQGVVNATLLRKFGPSAFENNLGLCSTGMRCRSTEANPPLMTKEIVKRSRSQVAVIAIAIAGAVFVILGIFITVFVRRRRRRMTWALKRPALSPDTEKYAPNAGPFSFEADSGIWVADVKDPNSVPVVIFEKPLLKLTFADLLQATGSFSRDAEVGEGFGFVYKCKLPGVFPDDSQVAIKVVLQGSMLKDHEAAEKFEAMAKIKHENLLPLLGYCVVGDERLLIYKLMQNGNLDDWLHALPEGDLDTSAEDWSLDTWEHKDEEDRSRQMDWATRLNIALGTARALAFLHHGCGGQQIVHGGVTSRSILLDANFEAHLADCSLEAGARLASPALRFMGSGTGYEPPEYGPNARRSSTTQADVYSFGVLLLELVTGKRPVGDLFPDGNCKDLVEWVKYLVREKRSLRAVDSKLWKTMNSREGVVREEMAMAMAMEEALRIGYLCTAEVPSKRPGMQQVVGLLKDLLQSGGDEQLASGTP